MDTRARSTGLVLAFAGLLVIIDTTVTIVALPAIVTDLETTLPRGAWMTTGYILGLIAVIPLTGWLAGRFGDRRVYLAGLTMFVLTSVAAGFSPNVETMIALRVLQGLGGGVLNPLGTAIAMRSVPKDYRGRIMSLVGLPILIGPALGAPLTGLLIDAASWRWLFWINLPLGVLALILCLRHLPAPQRSEDHARVDWPGLVMVTTGCVGLVLACTSIGDSGRVTLTTGVSVLAGLALLAGFARRSLSIAHPLVHVRLLARREIAAGAVITLCFAGGYFGASSILPAFVQGVRGDPVSVAGILAVPAGLAVGLTLQIATRLIDRIHPRRVIMLGTGTALTGAVTLGIALSLDAPYLVIGALSILVGVGSGATLMPTMVAATRSLDGPELPQASTVLALFSQLGNALGTALVASTITLLITARVDGLDPDGHGGLAAIVALEPAERAPLAHELASTIGLSYATPATLILVAFVATIWGMRTPAPERTSRPLVR
ncbi:DHA2 family efflux MFS transporter permease subunit [Nonomuraea sp. H19]|uniref:DHA2 family efflux MFS transporter permease subunit n=1 Tax=Nonomuraea sp. H19 TaxID=3452206 RepID=UPI003F8A3D8A